MTRKDLGIDIGKQLVLDDLKKTPVAYAGDDWEVYAVGKIRKVKTPKEKQRCHMFLNVDVETLFGCGIIDGKCRIEDGEKVISEEGYHWGAVPKTFPNYQTLLEITKGITIG